MNHELNITFRRIQRMEERLDAIEEHLRQQQALNEANLAALNSMQRAIGMLAESHGV